MDKGSNAENEQGFDNSVLVLVNDRRAGGLLGERIKPWQQLLIGDDDDDDDIESISSRHNSSSKNAENQK